MCVLPKYSCRVLCGRTNQRGAVTMEHDIYVHDDYCAGARSEDVRKILSEITTLITEAILRSASETKKRDTVA